MELEQGRGEGVQEQPQGPEDLAKAGGGGSDQGGGGGSGQGGGGGSARGGDGGSGPGGVKDRVRKGE